MLEKSGERLASFAICTFSGQYGDILWSLPTVREISRQLGQPVEFACMPEYESITELIQAQPYISKAFAIEDWICTGSPHGCQPWEAPVYGYEHIYHLTYRQHPHTFCLMDHIALQTGITPWPVPPVPFLKAVPALVPIHTIAYAFTPTLEKKKSKFLKRMKQEIPQALWLDISKMPWEKAARVLASTKTFIGCRSANYVLATGMGCEVLVYEPTVQRRPKTFGCPYNKEIMPNVDDMDTFIKVARSWMK